MGFAFTVIGILVLLAVLAAVAGIGTYNGLVGKRNRVQNAWAQIDVQLKRRHDLIPNLVNAVKGYMAHEREVLDRVTQARANAIAAGNDVNARAAAEGALSQAVRSLFVVAEAYPTLRANENMVALQEELSSTENRIAFARQFYNDAVMELNTAQQTFPAVLFASSLGFQPATPYVIDDAIERSVPTVAF